MANRDPIKKYLDNILSAVYGEEVRSSIHDSIAACYDDVHDPTLIKDGFQDTIRDMLDTGELQKAFESDIGLITEKTHNLFDFTDITRGRLSSGNVVTDNTRFVSDYIPVDAGTTYYFNNMYSKAFYDTNKVFQSAVTVGNTFTPVSSGYVRVCVASANKNTASMFAGSNKPYVPGRSPVDAVLRETALTKDDADNTYAPLPSRGNLGESGQVLRSTGTGTEWVTPGTPSPEQVESAVTDWLNDHPEATTTVQDGAVTEDKLANDSVSEDKIVDGSVTSDKLADNSVTSDKIVDGSISIDDLSENLQLMTVHSYVTPQMYGAVGNGITDDTMAFRHAFAADKKIIVPPGQYYLERCFWSDDSVVISDEGVYTNNGNKVIISRALREDSPITRGFVEFNTLDAGTSSTNLLKKANDVSGIPPKYTMQSACYNPIDQQIVIGFGLPSDGDNLTAVTDSILMVYDKNFNFIKSKTVTGGGHANGMCYDTKNNEILSVLGNGEHQLVVLNRSNLNNVRWSDPYPRPGSTGGSTLWTIAYDSDTDIYYMNRAEKDPEDNTKSIRHLYPYKRTRGSSADTWERIGYDEGSLDGRIDIDVSGEIDEITKLVAADKIVYQASLVVDNQFLIVFHTSHLDANTGNNKLKSSNGTFIGQYNYHTGKLKKLYRVDLEYPDYESEALVNVDGTIYLITSLGSPTATKTINGVSTSYEAAGPYIVATQLVFDNRVSGESRGVYNDPILLGRIASKTGSPVDLDTITRIGSYISGGPGTTGNLDNNAPCEDYGYTMFVFPMGQNNARGQFLISSRGDMFFRNCTFRPGEPSSPQRFIWNGWHQIAETPRVGAARSGSWYGLGYVSNQATQIFFTVPYPTPNISKSRPSCKVLELKIRLRQMFVVNGASVGDYLNNAVGDNVTSQLEVVKLVNGVSVLDSNYSSVTATVGGYGIDVCITKKSAFVKRNSTSDSTTYAVNNAPVAIECGVFRYQC